MHTAEPSHAAEGVGRSPLLDLPGAVAADGIDAGVAWHYGDPMGEQRAAGDGAVLLDRSLRELLTVSGPDRLSWLHTLSSQQLADLADGATTQALWLSPNGHVEHHAVVTELAGVAYVDTEPGAGASLQDFLDSMRFWSKVEVGRPATDMAMLTLVGPAADRIAALVIGMSAPEPDSAVAIDQTGDPSPDRAPRGFVRRTEAGLDVVVPRAELASLARRLIDAGARPAGTWAADALRVPTRRPRFGVDSDARTIPNEMPWLTTAVHPNKGCYRGQETVARVANLGRPPRRLVMLNLDGSADAVPVAGDPVTTADGRTVGRVGTVAQHWEDGPIALALVKRTAQPDTRLLAGGVDALVDPADALDDDGRPVSVVDRAAFIDVRRR